MTGQPGAGDSARAEQRRAEWLGIDVAGSDIGNEIERAKTRIAAALAELPDRAGAAALLRGGDVVAMARALGSQSDAAATILELADTIIGIEPDAERGRLVLRPRLPEEWKDVVVRNVRVGDAQILMRYATLPDVRRFTLTQTAGAYPIRLVFEPALTPPVRFAFVDGSLASLERREADGRIVMPVQIMLDDTRIVEFQG